MATRVTFIFIFFFFFASTNLPFVPNSRHQKKEGKRREGRRRGGRVRREKSQSRPPPQDPQTHQSMTGSSSPPQKSAFPPPPPLIERRHNPRDPRPAEKFPISERILPHNPSPQKRKRRKKQVYLLPTSVRKQAFLFPYRGLDFSGISRSISPLPPRLDSKRSGLHTRWRVTPFENQRMREGWDRRKWWGKKVSSFPSPFENGHSIGAILVGVVRSFCIVVFVIFHLPVIVVDAGCGGRKTKWKERPFQTAQIPEP